MRVQWFPCLSSETLCFGNGGTATQQPTYPSSRTRPRQGGEADGLQTLPAQVWACPHGRVPQEHGQQTG